MNKYGLHGCLCMGMFVALALGATAQDTEPKTFYVDRANISGTVLGTALHPYRRIGAALEQVAAGRGDTILVRPGTYDEIILLPPATKLIAEAGAFETEIEGNANAVENLVALTEGTLLQGFSVGPTSGNGVVVANGQSAEVRNCVFVDSARGISVDTGAELVCVNNTFDGNQTSINVESGGTVADARNNIFSNDTVGIFLNEGGALTSSYNCFFGFGLPVLGGSPDETDFRAAPGYVDAANGNLHLGSQSNLLDNGDPDAAYNDLDGTPNDLGADGGPTGELDLLAPYIGVEVTAAAKGGAGFSYDFDAAATFDYWGLAEVAWDFNLSDGLDFQDAFGLATNMTWDVAGRYVVSVRASDISGLVTEKHFVVVAGEPLAAAIFATKRASAPPLRVDLGALTSGEVEGVTWDLNLDGEIDARGFNATYIVPEAALPGSYVLSMEVQRTNSDSVSQAVLPITLTDARVITAQPVAPEDEVSVTSASGGPLFGAFVSILSFSLSSDAVVAIAEPDPEDFETLPEGNLAALAEFGPSDRPLGRRSLVSIPLAVELDEGAALEVYRWNAESEVWDAEGILFPRLTEDTVPNLQFEASQLGTFAVVADKIIEPETPQGCHESDITQSASMAGDWGVLAVAMLVLLVMGGIRRQRA